MAVKMQDKTELPPTATAEIDGVPLTPDGFVDNKAVTNILARSVAEAFQEDMDVKSPEQCAAIFILVGCMLADGFKAKEISQFSGLPYRFCAEVNFNLRYNKLVYMNRIAGDLAQQIEDKTAADFTVVLYALVAVGTLRTDFDAAGVTRYVHIDHRPDKLIYRVESVE